MLPTGMTVVLGNTLTSTFFNIILSNKLTFKSVFPIAPPWEKHPRGEPCEPSLRPTEAHPRGPRAIKASFSNEKRCFSFEASKKSCLAARRNRHSSGGFHPARIL